jgi:Secretion system C-terminal sorting domain/Right handed beta helix region
MKNHYKISSISLVLISVFSMLAMNTRATNYYLSKTSGNNSLDGTSPATAWASLSKVNTTSFSPGDIVSFEGGQTFDGNIIINNSGDSTAMIKLTSYGTGQAKINAGTGTAISCMNQGYIWIDNLHLYGGWDSKTQSGSNGGGIYFNNDLSNGVKLGTIKITNCEIVGFYGTGGHFGGGIVVSSWTGDGSSSGYKDIQITNNSVHDNGMGGIGIVGQYVSAGDTSYSFPKINVAYNKVYNNLGVTNYTSSHSGNGIVIGQVAGGVIEHNTTYNNGWLMGSTGGGPCGCWIWDSKNVTMQYNESYGNGTPKGKNDGDGLDFDGGVKNCIMQYNYVHDNYSVGILVCEFGNSRCSNSNNIIRYNVLENNNGPQSSLSEIAVSSFGGSVSNTWIYNNTCYNKNGSCVWDDATSSNYYNNIFYSIAKYPIISTGNSTSQFYNNCYFNTNGTTYKYNNKTYTSLENFRSTNNETLNSINGGYEVDPLFMSGGNGGIVGTNFPNTLKNYCLQNTSTIINRGYDLKNSGITSVGSTDFNLIAIPQNGYYSIGACVTTVPPNSINEIPKKNFQISPNPAKDLLTISGETTDGKDIRMFDMSSKMVMQSVMTDNVTLNVSNLKEGVYILNIQSGTIATNDKVIIKR